jgi:hypothetical protein
MVERPRIVPSSGLGPHIGHLRRSHLEIFTGAAIEVTLRMYLERATSVGGPRGESAHGN